MNIFTTVKRLCAPKYPISVLCCLETNEQTIIQAGKSPLQKSWLKNAQGARSVAGPGDVLMSVLAYAYSLLLLTGLLEVLDEFGNVVVVTVVSCGVSGTILRADVLGQCLPVGGISAEL